MKERLRDQGTKGLRVLLLLLCALCFLLPAFGQGPLPQIGSLPRGGGGAPVGTNIITSTNATSQFVTNLIVSLDLWTNDVFGGERVIRPVDQTRGIEASLQSTNVFGLQISANRISNGDGYALGGYIYNQTTNSALGSLYWQASKYGLVAESADANAALTAGDTAAVLGVADGNMNLQYGVVGLGLSKKNLQTSVGVIGVASSGGKSSTVRNGGFFQNITNTLLGPATTPATPLFQNAVIIGDSTTTGDALLELMTNSTSILFAVNAAGDPVILNAAGAGKVFICQDGTGLGKWQTVGAAGFGIGPGTNGFMARFVNTTNVETSVLRNTATNLVEFISRADGVAHTNENRFSIYGETTSATNFARVSLIAGKGHNSSANYLIGEVGSSYTDGVIPLNLYGTWNVEPTNAISGHSAGYLTPNADDVYVIGTSSSKVHSMTLGTGALFFSGTPGTPPSIKFSNATGIGQAGGAGSTAMGFYRSDGNVGCTAQFNGIYGQTTVFDLGSNLIGFGIGVSNVASWISCGDQIVAQLSRPGLIQIGTNSGTAAPLAVGLVGAPGTSTDKGGSDLLLIGGPSAGTGTNGNVRLQTVEKALATSSSINSGIKDRLFIIADPITLTTNAATVCFNFTIPTALRSAGGIVIAHTEIQDGVDIAAVDEQFSVTAVRKGSTVTTAISASGPISTLATGTATIATTWTAVANSQSVDVKCNCVTGGILSTNTTARITFIPNSSAVPVITHP